jgi:hypothetical protein
MNPKFNGMLAKILKETFLSVIQKPFLHLVLFISILVVTSLACNTVTGIFEEGYEYSGESYETKPEGDIEAQLEESTPPTENPETENNEPVTNKICPAVTKNILSAATQVEDDSDESYEEEPENQYLVTYQISGDQISDPAYESVSNDLQSYQDDTATHQQIWEYFITLIPVRVRTGLGEFMIVTDGESNGLAAVAQTNYDPRLWSLEVDIVDADDKLNLSYTLIHEYAHLLTLGPDQVTPSIAIFNNPDDDDIYYNEAFACPVYFPGEGCSLEDSYINAFFNRFWADIHEEWQDINLIEDDDAYYETLDDFYYKYEDRFVTDYAPTNPEEDIAEAFTFFVLSPRPDGNTIAEEKILFFYDYPELVELRNEIISGICNLNQ